MAEDYDDDMPALPPATDTDTDTGTDTQDAAPAPPPGGAPIPESAPVSLRDRALEGLDPETRSAVILEASDLGTRDRNDASWMLFRKLRDATDAASSASRAADRIEAATKDVAKTIFDQTHRAGEDLKGLVSSGIRETTLNIGKKIGNAIDIVTQRGAEKIINAASELDQSAHDKMSAMVQEYKGHLAKAARQEAERRSSFTGAVRWGIILAAIFGSLLFGAANGWFGYRYAHGHNLTPAGLEVFRQPGGGYILYFSPPPVAKLRFVPCRISGHICLQVTPVQ